MMITKIEAESLEKAYQDAASALNCSVTELEIEVVQHPSKGYLGMFKKSAIIVAVKNIKNISKEEIKIEKQQKIEPKKVEVEEKKEPAVEDSSEIEEKPKENLLSPKVKQVKSAIHNIFSHSIIPTSFTTSQSEIEESKELKSVFKDSVENDIQKVEELEEEDLSNINVVVKRVSKEINSFFGLTCFEIDKIEVSAYDNETLLIEFKGKDAALLIGKEGYRYKAISYMLFNWINSKYKVQLRLEIAEFLKNQEESVARYIETVCESVESDGKAQTKILDGVLVQIALKELRDRYPDKYVVIRSTRDGLKYIIINDYHSN